MTRQDLPKRVSLDWFQLTCGHYMTTGPSVTQPKVGDEYWCRQHCALSTIRRKLRPVEVFVSECQDCRYTRTWGPAKLTAKVSATKHAARHTGHTVTVYDGKGDVVQISKHQPPSETLDF